MRLARFLGAVGRTCITAGTLILLFVAYQLWGTGIRTAQAQDRLDREFEEALEAAESTTTTSTTVPDPGEPEPVPTIEEPAPVGSPIARIVIPEINVDWKVVEGVSLQELKKGPGHYPETPLPGQEGNAAIAGHRTTYGAPFHRLDELAKGDVIRVTTVQGEFTYEVSETLIVRPTEVQVLEDKEDNRLTLTACHPKYSARERIVVVSKLTVGQEPLPPAPRAPIVAATLDLDGEGAPAWPAVALGGACALIWLLAWLVGRWWRRWPSYLIGFPFFMVTLYFFFEEFSRLLPSNF